MEAAFNGGPDKRAVKDVKERGSAHLQSEREWSGERWQGKGSYS